MIFKVFCLLATNSPLAFQPSVEQINEFNKLGDKEKRELALKLGVDVPSITDSGSQLDQVFENQVVQKRIVSDGQEQSPNKIKNNIRKSARDDGAKLTEEQRKRSIERGLSQFGYDLFAGSPSTFAPALNIPVPLEYVVGPGDSVRIQLYGKENKQYEIPIDREGVLQFPSLGPIAINGFNFRELKERIEDLVKEQMIGVKVSVSMGALRSIQVFVLGEAFAPGLYTISSLSTMTNALFYSGGIKKIGSLRKIQLKRRGSVVTELDLYDLLLRGDTSADQRLLPGDVIFIPPIGKTVGVAGEVRRPGIYELNKEQSVEELINIAGGYLPTAYLKESRIDRIAKEGHRTFVDLDLSENIDSSKLILDGDVIHVYSILDKAEDVVLLKGHVQRPGGFEWKSGMVVSDIIGEVSELLPNPDLDFGLIKREWGEERKLKAIFLNLREALQNKSSKENIKLHSRDEIMIFSASSERTAQMKSIVEDMRKQTEAESYPRTVKVMGNVKYPGEYPITDDMTVQSLFSAAGGLLAETDVERMLLVRKSSRDGKVTVSIIGKELKKIIEPADEIIVFKINTERQKLIGQLIGTLRQQSSKVDQGIGIVGIDGEVKFPGSYPLVDGMTVADLIDISGGLKESAYTLEAEITRFSIGVNQEQINERIEVGLHNSSVEKLILKPKDKLIVKKIPNWEEMATVRVVGQVYFPGDYPVVSGDRLSDLLKRAGGLTKHADAGAAIFLRESLRKKEMEMLDAIERQVKKDIQVLEASALVGGEESTRQRQAMMAEAKILDKIGSAEPSGRLVIDLVSILEGNYQGDVVLLDGDMLVLPEKQQEVSLLGEVNFPTSHVHSGGSNITDFINMSGGLTKYADLSRVYIVRKNGLVRPGIKRMFYFFKRKHPIQPGDTIVVPIDSNVMRPIDYWVGTSQVLFQLATTAAALKTVGAF